MHLPHARLYIQDNSNIKVNKTDQNPTLMELTFQWKLTVNKQDQDVIYNLLHINYNLYIILHIIY